MAFDNAMVDGFVASLKNEDTIKIYIGPKTESNTPFIVRPDILCRGSRYFRQALSANFRDGVTRTLEFPDDDEKGWSLLLYYLHRDEVPAQGKQQSTDIYLLSLVHACVLADKYGLGALQNQITRRYLDFAETSTIGRQISIECTLQAVQLLPPSCSLRTLILQEIVTDVMADGKEDWEAFADLGACPKAFGVLMKSLAKWAGETSSNTYPDHEYGRDEEETAKYLVNEEELAETLDT